MPYNQHSERTPAQQADEMIAKTKVGMNLAAKKGKHIWAGFSQPEKIIAVSALVGLVAVFLPWMSGWNQISQLLDLSETDSKGTKGIEVIPLLFMAASFALLYFTQGASEKKKTLAARWQIVIGSVGAVFGFAMIALIYGLAALIKQIVSGLGGLFAVNLKPGIGVYLFVACSIAIVVGAFKLQAMLIGRPPKQPQQAGTEK